MNKTLARTHREWVKIKVKDYGIETEYSETKVFADENGEESSELVDITCRHNGLPHEDFHAAMNALAPHLLVLTEWADHPDAIDENLLRKITVTSISFGGSDEHAGVTITGQKKLETGKIFNMNSPFMKFGEAFDEHNPGYPYSGVVDELCSSIQKEAEAFMQGKRKPDPQLEFDFPKEASVNVTLKAVGHD